MTDRLKQIWSGFEGQTTRRLTGRGVDNIAVPHRQDWQADDLEHLPQNFDAPSHAAFEALKASLAAKEKKSAKRRPRRGETAELAAPPARSSLDGDLKPVRDLIRGLRSTEDRIARSDFDYSEHLAANPQRKRGLFGGKRVFGAVNDSGRKKRFFGLF